MKYVSFLCVLFSGLLSTVALGEPDRSSHVATQAEVEQDSFLRGTARNLEKSDVVLSVIIYKIVSTDQGTTHYARVVQSLRGDIPADGKVEKDYQYASQLIAEIKAAGDFCIGAACYPEGHVESVNKTADIQHLKEKVEAGCDFVTTQMFFDNNILYNYLYRIREKGIMVPVIAGIMPVTNSAQIKRICSMSGTYLPSRFKAIVDRFGDNPAAMKQAGIAYATEQIIDLIANHVNGIHVYSMNKPDVAAQIKNSLSEIVR